MEAIQSLTVANPASATAAAAGTVTSFQASSDGSGSLQSLLASLAMASHLSCQFPPPWAPTACLACRTDAASRSTPWWPPKTRAKAPRSLTSGAPVAKHPFQVHRRQQTVRRIGPHPGLPPPDKTLHILCLGILKQLCCKHGLQALERRLALAEVVKPA